MANKSKLKGKGRDSYLDLVREFPLASIKSERQLADSQRVIETLLAKGEMDSGESMYLEALCDLIATYEDTHHAIGPASDADMLRHFLELKGITQSQLSTETEIPKSSISEVLAGKKSFSRQMIRKLAEYFQVDVSLLAANL